MLSTAYSTAQEVEINPGDTIEWKWTLTVKSSETGISVHQVDSPTTNEYNGKGFKAEKSPKGRFRHKFDTPGTYYFSSQAVFGAELFMSGLVKVVPDLVDSTTSLTVTMGGLVEAEQQVVADTGSITVTNCSMTATQNCTSDPPSSDSYLFTLAVCLTPAVTSVATTAGAANFSLHPVQGFNGAELTILGEGFSENSCQNIVGIGEEHQCQVTSATSTKLVCNIDGSGETPLPSLTSHRVSITVLNAGTALISVADPETAVFFLVPKVTATNAANSEIETITPTTTTAVAGNTTSPPPTADFCDISPDHTMCKWSGPSVECAAKTSAREFTEEGRQVILDKHNELRRRVAKGEEADQPAASNMKELLWSAELVATAQRWAGQCTFGHDSERKKADGMYVGQNAFIGMSSQTSDTAAMMAAGSITPTWITTLQDLRFSPQKVHTEMMVLESQMLYWSATLWFLT